VVRLPHTKYAFAGPAYYLSCAGGGGPSNLGALMMAVALRPARSPGRSKSVEMVTRHTRGGGGFGAEGPAAARHELAPMWLSAGAFTGRLTFPCAPRRRVPHPDQEGL